MRRLLRHGAGAGLRRASLAEERGVVVLLFHWLDNGECCLIWRSLLLLPPLPNNVVYQPATVKPRFHALSRRRCCRRAARRGSRHH